MQKKATGLLLALSLSLTMTGCGSSGELKKVELPEVEEQPQVEDLPQVEEQPQVEDLPQIEEQPQTEKQPEVEKQPEMEQKSDAEAGQDKDGEPEIIEGNEEQKDGESQEEEEIGYYGGILKEVGYNKDKTYTLDEYVKVLTKICEALDKKYNQDIPQDFEISEVQGEKYGSLIIVGRKSFEGYYIEQIDCVFDFSNHEQTKQNTYGFMDYLEFGKDGTGSIAEFYIQSSNKDGEETVSMLLKNIIENE